MPLREWCEFDGERLPGSCSFVLDYCSRQRVLGSCRLVLRYSNLNWQKIARGFDIQRVFSYCSFVLDYNLYMQAISQDFDVLVFCNLKKVRAITCKFRFQRSLGFYSHDQTAAIYTSNHVLKSSILNEYSALSDVPDNIALLLVISILNGFSSLLALRQTASILTRK